MAEAKPLWSALYHSLTLTETEDYEYRRSSIYKNIDAKYRINIALIMMGKLLKVGDFGGQGGS